jgi:LPXTG-motif cell wall-anchored protein
VPLLVAVSLAGFAATAGPALAGTDSDAPPPPAEQSTPLPPPPAPLPLPEATPAPPAAVPVVAPAPTPETLVVEQPGHERAGKPPKHRRTTRHAQASHAIAKATPVVARTARVTTTAAAGPKGGVQAGFGGTAATGSTPAGAIGLAGASVVLLAAGGAGLARRRRRLAG